MYKDEIEARTKWSMGKCSTHNNMNKINTSQWTK